MKKIMLIAGLLSLAFLASCGQKVVDNIADTTTNTIDNSLESLETIANDVVADSVDTVEEVMEKTEEVMVKSEDVMEKSEDVMVKEEEVMVKEEVAQEVVTESEPEAPVALAGQYADYDSSLVGATDNTVIFFGAAWCPGCVSADKTFSTSAIPDGLTLLKADYDTAKDLRKKYSVASQHTFVQIDADGNEVKKWVGGYNVDDVISKIK